MCFLEKLVYMYIHYILTCQGSYTAPMQITSYLSKPKRTMLSGPLTDHGQDGSNATHLL